MLKYSAIRIPGRVMLDLAQRAKELRKQQALSQLALANRTGVSLGSIRRFEQTGEISLSKLLMISYQLVVRQVQESA